MMGLPEFIKKMLGFVEKSEANMKAEQALAAALDKIAELEKENAALKAAGPDGEVAIKQLRTDLDSAKASLLTKEKELVDFKAQAAKDLEAAQNKANEVLASMGISQDQIPPAGAPSGNPKGQGQDPVADLRAKLAKSTDPKEKFVLAQKIRALTSPEGK